MLSMQRSRWQRWVGLAGVAIVLTGSYVMAQDAPAAPATLTDVVARLDAADKSSSAVANTMWTLIAAMLVFFMNLGFCTLETGLCRRKNAVNILAKNFIVFGISAIAYWVAGFAMMMGGERAADGTIVASKFIGMTGFLPSLLPGTAGDFPGMTWSNVAESVKFLFQLVFAGTAATIVSGAVAERVKFGMFIIFSFLLIAIIYPITGHWVWGGGWLSTLAVPFHDFAGSTVVHSVGGWAALAGVIVLGPRIGKYLPDGSVKPIAGHNMGLAAIGTFVLWLGWFGFNPGSTMTWGMQAGHVAATTNTGACFGSVAATIVAWIVLGKPDFSMILNGCLAGLVAVTAPCAVITVGGAAIIGTIAGGAAVLGVLFFDKLKLDDPVGALTVHLLGGTFGTICVALFAAPSVIDAYGMAAYCKPGLFYGGGIAQLKTQLIGMVAVGGTSFVASMVFWVALKAIFGIRVSAAEEIEGLDIGEHGMEAYPGFAKEDVDGTIPAEALQSSAKAQAALV